MMQQTDDVVIIGAGMGGLYAAHLLKEKHPELSVVVLEKSGRIGGRAGYHNFQGTRVAIGAGVGRLDKDHRLKKLVHKFGIQYQTAPVNIRINMPRSSRYQSMLEKLKGSSAFDSETFQQFATRVLGAKGCQTFIEMSGYSDYTRAAATQTMECYGLDDTLPGWTAMYIPWDQLQTKFAEGIDIRLKSGVASVEREANGLFTVTQASGQVHWAKVVLLAVPIKHVLKLLPVPNRQPIQQSIGWSPFLRVYAKLDDKSIRAMPKTYTVMLGNLRKFIPIRPDKGVFMIGYSDNEYAIQVRPYAQKKDVNYFAQELRRVLNLTELPVILNIWCKWWDVGTHYYKPRQNLKDLDTLRYPFGKNAPCAIIGESVAACNQGWVEGALESSENVLRTFEKKMFFGVL